MRKWTFKEFLDAKALMEYSAMHVQCESEEDQRKVVNLFYMIEQMLKDFEELQDSDFNRIKDKYMKIVKAMDFITINPPPDCRPIKSTSKKRMYKAMYDIQHTIGKIRFEGEDHTQ